MTGHYYTHEEIMYILVIHQGLSYQEITDRVNRRFGLQLTVGQIKGFLANRHWITGRTGYFQKGHVPYNKGAHICPAGCEKTQFKPGNIPANHRPVGSERINVDGYTEVKVAEPKKWRMKHVLIWEAANGPLPRGHAVIFGDGDKTNFNPDNLVLVTRAELGVLNHNGLIQGDAELTRTGVLIAQMIMRCRDRQKKRSEAAPCSKMTDK